MYEAYIAALVCGIIDTLKVNKMRNVTQANSVTIQLVISLLCLLCLRLE